MVLDYRWADCDRDNYMLCEEEGGGEKMTLLEMIKKYEGVKEDLVLSRKPILSSGAMAADSIEIVDHILKDLNSVAKHTTVDTLYAKILRQIDKAITNDDPDGARTWAHTLAILPE